MRNYKQYLSLSLSAERISYRDCPCMAGSSRRESNNHRGPD